MQKPILPKKPYKPRKPNEFLQPTYNTHSVNERMTITDIINIVGKNNLNDAFIGHEQGYEYDFVSATDVCNVYIEWYSDEKQENPHYKNQLKKYKEKLAKYNKEKPVYEAALKKYVNAEKEYLIWFHSNELKKLG
jgi:hypothetical protein